MNTSSASGIEAEALQKTLVWFFPNTIETLVRL
jgi:hypothetical protein